MLAAVKTAARRPRRKPSAGLDRHCARRSAIAQVGQRNIKPRYGPNRNCGTGTDAVAKVERGQAEARCGLKARRADYSALAHSRCECSGSLGWSARNASWAVAGSDAGAQSETVGHRGAGRQNGPHRLGPAGQGWRLPGSGRGSVSRPRPRGRGANGRKVWRIRSARPDRDNQARNNVTRLRGVDVDPVRELPYRPAGGAPHQRPDGWQHPTTRLHSPEVSPCPEEGVHGCYMDGWIGCTGPNPI